MNIKTIPFQRLLKLELPQLAEHVIDKIQEHEPEVMKITEVYDLLVAQQANIQSLKIAYGPHPITEQLIPLRKKRFMYAAKIVYKMNVIVREDTYPDDSDVIATRIKINSYLLNLSASKNEEVIAEKLTQFFRETQENEDFSEAISLFQLVSDIDSLKAVDFQIRRLLKKRADDISARPRVKTPVLVNSIHKALKDMFKEIESAQLRNPSIDYSELVNKLNDLLSHYKTLINMRATINKRKAAGLEDDKGDNEPIAPVEGGGDTHPDLPIEPTEGNV